MDVLVVKQSLNFKEEMMKYTVVTGASSGIGRATAIKLANLGYNLIIVARRTDKLNELKSEINNKYPNIYVVVEPTDLSAKGEIEDLYQFISKFELSMLLNIAGLGASGQIIDSDIEAYERMVDVNIRATMMLSQLFVKDYSDKDVQLINVSSAVGYLVAENNVVYSASKFFINAFTQGLANETKNNKIQVKIFAPALTATDFIGYTDQSNLPPDVKSVDEVTDYLLELIESEYNIGLVNPKNDFVLTNKVLEELNGFGV